MPRVHRHRSNVVSGAIVIASGTLLLSALRLFEQRAEAAAVVHSAPLVTLVPAAADAAAIRDGDIHFYEQRVAADRESAIDRATLATLLFSRARAIGSPKDLDRAEQVARESIALRGTRNGQAYELLATILMTRHAFREAHAVASRANAVAPGTPSHLALLGEIELELGEYDAAASHFRSVHFDGQEFTIGARIARWYELTGRTSVARAMLQRAIAQVEKRDDLPREQAAWFDYRLGALELRLGRAVDADSAFARGLRRHPGDVRILSGLARSALMQRSWRRAIQLAEDALASELDPETLATLSAAWAGLGDTVQAAHYTSALSLTALSQPGPLHREWGLHLLDHGSARDRAEVLRRAQADLRGRRDIYGYDLLAWALHRAGRADEARAVIRHATAFGTEDVSLAARTREILGPSAPIATR
jgi:tetratricopeptide (TPR) repeat protein